MLSPSPRAAPETPLGKLRAQEQGLIKDGRKDNREERLREVGSAYLLGAGFPPLRPLNARRRVQALLLGSADLRGGGDALDGRHRPGQLQQPVSSGPGDGTPQGNPFGASSRIQRGLWGGDGDKVSSRSSEAGLGWVGRGPVGRAQGSPREDAAKPSESLLFLSLSLIWMVSRATLLASDSSEARGTGGCGPRDRAPRFLGWPFLACQPLRGASGLRFPGSARPLKSCDGFSSKMLGVGWRGAEGDRDKSSLAHGAQGGTRPQQTLWHYFLVTVSHVPGESHSFNALVISGLIHSFSRIREPPDPNKSHVLR